MASTLSLSFYSRIKHKKLVESLDLKKKQPGGMYILKAARFCYGLFYVSLLV